MVEQIKARLRELGGMKPSQLSYADKQEIERLYAQVLDKTFVRTGCNDCYRDACIVAYNYLARHGACATHRDYVMRIGACVQLAFGKAEFLTAANCTDEKARQHLNAHPEDITLFETYPANWQEDVKPKVKNVKRRKNESKYSR